MFIEIDISKEKWLLIGGYNPNKSSIETFLFNISNNSDQLAGKYENLITMADFNAEEHLLDFCETFNLQNIVKNPTCFKNPENPTTIDLILTTRKSKFQNTMISKNWDL